PLLEEDERAGAAPVVVIGYDIWQSHLAGDRAAIGQTVQLGGVDHIVVGIMPDGFAFPVRHQVWIPFRGLRESPQNEARAKKPTVIVFARLAPGGTIDSAQSEIAAIGPALRDPRGNEAERVRVLSYADSFRGGLIVGPAVVWLQIIPVLLGLLLVPP